MDNEAKASPKVIPPIPRGLLLGIYVLYCGLPTTASVPLFADIDWLHEGERIGVAQIVLDGGLPFRDAYLPHGLFSEVIRPLLAFWMFGESLAADRLMGLLIQPLTYVAAAVYLWRVFPTRFWRVVGMVGFALYPLLLVPRHIVVFLALGFLTAWVHERRGRLLLVAGLIAGLGSVGSTVDQALVLLATLLVFPFVLTIEQVLAHRKAAPKDSHAAFSVRAVWVGVAAPLWAGMSLGLLPFLVFMSWAGAMSTFMKDLVSRAEAEVFASTHVWNYTSYPSVSTATWIWYAIPIFYVGLSALILVRLFRFGDRRWAAVVPTLLFGIGSFVYAIRQFTYWKLAVVSFPFVVGVVYVLQMVMEGRPDMAASQDGRRHQIGEQALLGISALSMGGVAAHALFREWTEKQAIPRALFPTLALLTLVAAVTVAIKRLRAPSRHVGLVMAWPLAALIVASWYFNESQPQLATAFIKKPRLVKDVRRLVHTVATEEGGLTRDHPVYVDDEVIKYMKALPPKHKRVVILAAGAGVYYFLAGQSPPNRFPGVELAMADAWAQEVVDGLERSKADLLVACNDHGRTVTGWPMKPILSNYIAAHYTDSGVRLNSKMLGADCPFSVWVHRGSAQETQG